MKKAIISDLPLSIDLASLVLRILFGGLFIYHGMYKLAAYHDIVLIFPDPIGIGSKYSFILVITAELLGGILVVLGLFTRLAILPIFITMFIAFFITHASDAFNVKELAMVFMILALVLFILGSGRISVDRLLQKP